MPSVYFSASVPVFLTRRYTTSVRPGSHSVLSSNTLVVSLTFFHSVKSLLYSNCTSRFPAWILFTAVLAVSVNHAKVVPMSITMHITTARRLRSSARLVTLRFVISCLPPDFFIINTVFPQISCLLTEFSSDVGSPSCAFMARSSCIIFCISARSASSLARSA